jgi:insertion element IS1 protein InsB
LAGLLQAPAFSYGFSQPVLGFGLAETVYLAYWCFKLSGFMECQYCKGKCQKAGRQKNGTQKFYCGHCKKYQQGAYRYRACMAGTIRMIPLLVCESVGIRSIGRILKIATATVLRKILVAATAITKPPVPLNRPAFEMDELRTFLGHKGNQYWIAYAICPSTKTVIDFAVGKRSKRTLKMVVNTLLLSGVGLIKTDKLNIYQSLIPAERHCRAIYGTNHIERYNLNLRTHLKRLGRRTICFSKSRTMLEACVKIYFWGRA